ncbi:MAG: hypothetical protein V3V31_16225 [Methylococcales bacterium]
MSRTPEIIVIKSRVDLRNNLYGAGLMSGFISWVVFESNMVGAGLSFAGICGLLIWIGTQIKTTYVKTAEAARYQ